MISNDILKSVASDYIPISLQVFVHFFSPGRIKNLNSVYKVLPNATHRQPIRDPQTWVKCVGVRKARKIGDKIVQVAWRKETETSLSALNSPTEENWISYRRAQDLQISPLWQEQQKQLCEGIYTGKKAFPTGKRLARMIIFTLEG